MTIQLHQEPALGRTALAVHRAVAGQKTRENAYFSRLGSKNRGFFTFHRKVHRGVVGQKTRENTYFPRLGTKNTGLFTLHRKVHRGVVPMAGTPKG